jgi:hypothetical protein
MGRLPSLKDWPMVRGGSAKGSPSVKAALERPDLFAGAIRWLICWPAFRSPSGTCSDFSIR